MKKNLTALLLLFCTVVCTAQNTTRKLKKPVFVAAEKRSELFDILATDSYDSLSYSMKLVMDDMGSVARESHLVNIYGRETIYRDYYSGIYDVKYLFYRKGYEETDTLFGWRVTGLRDDNEIMLNNEGTSLKIFGTGYGRSVSVYTPDSIMIVETAIKDKVTELEIPTGLEYLNVDIRYDESYHYLFRYPVR